MTTVDIPTEAVYGLYGRSWKGLLTPNTRHPAKFSRKLIYWAIERGLERGFWSKDSVLIDPFSGVGCGGIAAADLGVSWVGVELEQKFVEMAEANFALHTARWSEEGRPLPLTLQGDSRYLRDILAKGADGAILSPPYANRVDDHGKDAPGYKVVENMGTYGPLKAAEGQIGVMRAGGSVSSPPFTPPDTRDRHALQPGPVSETMRRTYTMDNTAETEGNIGKLDLGKQSYWDAVRQVYEELFAVLQPGSVAAVVLKDFVKDKRRVNLCEMTLDLLTQIGYIPLERTIAMLTNIKPDGSVVSYKSFFRRNAEAKGSPPIDWEEVVWVGRP